MVFLELSLPPLSPRCSPWVSGWPWFTSGMLVVVALWGWLVVLVLFFKLICTLCLVLCFVSYLLWPSFSWGGYVLDGLSCCIIEYALLLFVGLPLCGCIRSKKVVVDGGIVSDMEFRVQFLKLGTFLMVGRPLEFWNLCERARVLHRWFLGFRVMEGLGRYPIQDSEGSYKKLFSALVVSMLVSSLIAIWLLVKLGNKRISSAFSLVMASPAIAVNQILKEAPQLSMLREASSSIVLFSHFQVKQQFVELQMNATYRQRSQEVSFLPWDDVNGEGKISPNVVWQSWFEVGLDSQQLPSLWFYGFSARLYVYVRYLFHLFIFAISTPLWWQLQQRMVIMGLISRDFNQAFALGGRHSLVNVLCGQSLY